MSYNIYYVNLRRHLATPFTALSVIGKATGLRVIVVAALLAYRYAKLKVNGYYQSPEAA